MFIISLTYITPLETIDQYLAEHTEFLMQQYNEGNFIVSGRKVPRTGGVIISQLKDKQKLLSILDKDPFKKNNLAKYELFEFHPTMTSKELEFLID